MKKKISSLLMAATLVFAVGAFFSSCRDHDEELWAEIDAVQTGNQTSLTDSIKVVNDSLASAKVEMTEKVDSVKAGK